MARWPLKTAVLMASCVANSGHGQSLPVDADIIFTALAPGETDEMLFLDVEINGRERARNVKFAKRGPQLYGRKEDLEGWRISLGNTHPVIIDGELYVTIGSLDHVQSEIDEQRQVLILKAAGRAFKKEDLQAQNLAKPTQGTFSAFLNYDMSLQYDDHVEASAYTEMGISDNWGVATNSMVLDTRSDRVNATRLETYLLHDNPNALTRMTLGDAITSPSGWARALRFGGVKISTAFALQPDYVTFPTPVLSGTNALPSTVDIFVNNVLQYRTDTDEGPFTVENVPLVTGSGEIALNIKDVMGIEHTYTTSYYASPNLLKPGLADWTIELGAARRHFGYRSFSYGKAFGSAGYRRGLTSQLTAGGQISLASDTQALGVDVNLAMLPFGELNWSSAISTSDAGTGARYRISGRHIAPRWNFSVSYEQSSPDFRQPGSNILDRQIHAQVETTAAISLGQWGHLGISYTGRERFDGMKLDILSGNYNVNIERLGFLNIYALRSWTPQFGTDTLAGISLTIAFGPRSSGYLQADGDTSRGELRLTPPTDAGWGYRLAASEGRFQQLLGEISHRAVAGNQRIQFARVDGRNAARLLASGGIVWAGGKMLPGNNLGDAMAVVTVPGRSGVAIYDDNRLVAHTDANGRALITGLRPYTANRISISPSDIPLGDSLERASLVVVPRFRGTAIARFETRQIHPATIILRMPDNSVIEPGTRIFVGEEQHETFVGIGGEVFINQLTADTQVIVETKEGGCVALIPAVVHDAGPLPVLGPFSCAIVTE